jgi:hypothetical protein
MTTAMFKLAQYAPSADPVNLTRVVFFWLPSSLQAACHAQPFESKTLFLMSYALFFAAWMVSVVLAIWAQVGRLGGLGANEVEKLPMSSHEYEMPPHFQRVQNWASTVHAITLLAQTLGLYGWRLGAEAQFRVTPRLKRLSLQQPGRSAAAAAAAGKPKVLYSADSSVGGAGVGRGGSRSGGGGRGYARARNNNTTRSGSISNARARRERERSLHFLGGGGHHGHTAVGYAASALQGGIHGGMHGLSALGRGVLGGIQSGFHHGAQGFHRHGLPTTGEAAAPGGEGGGEHLDDVTGNEGERYDHPPQGLLPGGIGKGRVLGGVVGGVVGGLGGLATGVVGGGLNAVFGNGYGEVHDDDEEADEDDAEVIDGEPLFFNVITGIKPTNASEDVNAAEDEDFVLYFKVRQHIGMHSGRDNSFTSSLVFRCVDVLEFFIFYAFSNCIPHILHVGGLCRCDRARRGPCPRPASAFALLGCAAGRA